MKLITSFVLAAAVSTVSSSAIADRYTVPNSEQRLPKPIELKACHLTITEWRKGKFSGTAPSPEGIKRLNQLCATALEAYPKFLEAEHLPPPDDDTLFHGTLSIMPYNIDEDGLEKGNLNDDYRFRTRKKFYNAAGLELSLYGYLDRSDDYIYIRNDVFSPEFAKVFSHEFCHFLNSKLGLDRVFYHNGDIDSQDEITARKFTKFLGMGE